MLAVIDGGRVLVVMERAILLMVRRRIIMLVVINVDGGAVCRNTGI